MSNIVLNESSKVVTEIPEKIPYLQSIDKSDTISDLINKLNDNFSIITQTGIFDIKENEQDEHDYLCDALLIKPHQPIHRRKHILTPLENRKDISWLGDVDYMCGDIAIVEQKRIEDESTTRVYMYTIQKSSGPYEIELVNETEITGPVGRSGEIYLSQETLDKLDRISFDKLTVDKLNVRSINLLGDSVLSVNKINTNRLQVGNLIFENTDDNNAILATNTLQVDTIIGFNGENPETKTITFGSQVIIDKISASDKQEQTTFETGIKTNIISGKTNTDNISINSPITSSGNDIVFKKGIKVNNIGSNNTQIIFDSPISVREITSSTNIKINSPVFVDVISASGNNSISINSDITSFNNLISFDTNVNFKKNINFNENNLHFKQFDFSDKLIAGQVFLALDNIQTIEIPDITINTGYDFSKYGKSYSFVPCIGKYGIARIKKDENEWYALISKHAQYADVISDEGVKKIFTTSRNDDINMENEDKYDLISTNNIYKTLFDCLYNSIPTIDDTLRPMSLDINNIVNSVNNENNITIGFNHYNGQFETITECEIDIVKIESLDYSGRIGNKNLVYYMTVY